MKIMILFPKVGKVKSAKARKQIKMSDTVKKQVQKDKKNADKAVPKKKAKPKGKKK
jgi:hypothetical protein